MTNVNHKPKIALLIFLYSLDRLQDLEILVNKLENISIWLTVGSEIKNHPKILHFITNHQHQLINFDYHDNYGVDIAPFLKQIVQLNPDIYPYFIKLHSKSSKLGSNNQIDWGSLLWDSLIGNPNILSHNINILQSKNVGALTQKQLIFHNRELNNGHKIQVLCQHLDINYDQVKHSKFMAGSMFMGKTNIYHNILQNKIDYIDLLLSNEIGKVDDRNYINGTFSHALERILGYILSYQSYDIYETSLFPIVKIYNSTIQNKLHLHIMYNNYCYMVEDMSIFGYVLNNKDDYIDIQWQHVPELNVTRYKYLDNKILTRV